MTNSPSSAPSPRTTVKRGANRADYNPQSIREILAAGVIAHVGVTTDDGPIVLPMAYGIVGDRLAIHGGVANAMMRAGNEVDVCVTVTLVDGLVVARTPLHNSMNYRSVVVRGTATKVTDADEKRAVLKVINDHVADLWDNARPPSDADYRQTMVLTVPLTEASAKVRTGDPIDDPEDLDGPHWAGVVPYSATWGTPQPSADLTSGADVPAPIQELGNSAAQ